MEEESVARPILFIGSCRLTGALLVSPAIGFAQPTPPPPGMFQKWPAIPESPEQKAERQQAKQATASINQGRFDASA